MNWVDATMALVKEIRLAVIVARRVRVQYCNALYHVINRGNYRRSVFGTVGAEPVFEKANGEVCECLISG